jgi:serine/threonine-protein kinase
VNGSVLGDRYQVEARIGAGGMAEVYRGVDPVLNRPVAIKILLPQFARDASFVDRFRREAQAAARLNHPNIVAVYDTGSSDDTQWIVMEFIEGRTLQDFLSGDRRPTPEQACEIAEHICDALAAAHARGVIHRDIKPGNVMVTRSGAVKLMDLGIARLIAGPETAPQTSAVLGTAAYMSPEQAQGASVDARTDLYSLGAVLYEMLTGRPPFTGDSPVAIAYKQVNESPPLPSAINPDVSPQLDAVVLRALSKNPANRYQSAEEFAQDIRNARTGGTVSATPLLPAAEATQVISRPRPTSVLPPSEEPPGSGRKVWLGVLIGVLVVAILGAAAFLIANFLADEDTPTVENVVVPNVVGLPIDEATAALDGEGLEWEIVGEPTTFDEEQADTVRRQNPSEGTSVDPATRTVELVVWRLAESSVVPTLAGLTPDEAAEALADVGLEIGDVTEEPSDDVDVGRVTRADPAEGEEVELGSQVDLFVSSGPSDQPVPDVTCLSVNKATKDLRDAGFDPVFGGDTAEPNPLCPTGNKVAAQDPPAGETHPAGTTVTIFTATATPPEGE